MNRNLKNNSANYEVPQVEVIEVEVEKGFAASVEPVGERYDDIDW